MKQWWCGLVLIAAAAGCKRHKSLEPADDRAAVDALWKLAPDRARIGIVVSPRAVGMAGHAFGDLMKIWDSVPEAAANMPAIRKKLVDAFGTTELTPETVGWDPHGGVAGFVTVDEKGFIVLPVADETKWKKYLAKIEEERGAPVVCRTTHGVYACADEAATFDLMGTGTLDAAFAGARGDVELAMVNLDVPQAPNFSIAMTATLTSGAITVHGGMTPIPDYLVAMLSSASAPRTEGNKTTGFVVAPLKGLFPAPANPLGASIEDPLTISSTSSTIDLRIPLNDPAPMQETVEHCANGPLAALGAKLEAGTCVFTPSPGFALGARVDGKTLRIERRDPRPAEILKSSPLADELASGRWPFVLYARGSIVGSSPRALGLPDLSSEMAQGVRLLSLVNELGLGVKVEGRSLRVVYGVRTIFSNPPNVVDKLLALDPQAVADGKGRALAKTIADSAPGTPFAEDVKASDSGMAIPLAVAGFLYRYRQLQQ